MRFLIKSLIFVINPFINYETIHTNNYGFGGFDDCLSESKTRC